MVNRTIVQKKTLLLPAFIRLRFLTKKREYTKNWTFEVNVN